MWVAPWTAICHKRQNALSDNLQHSAFLSLHLKAQASHLCTLASESIPLRNLKKTVCRTRWADGISKSNTVLSPQCPLVLCLIQTAISISAEVMTRAEKTVRKSSQLTSHTLLVKGGLNAHMPFTDTHMLYTPMFQLFSWVTVATWEALLQIDGLSSRMHDGENF